MSTPNPPSSAAGDRAQADSNAAASGQASRQPSAEDLDPTGMRALLSSLPASTISCEGLSARIRQAVQQDLGQDSPQALQVPPTHAFTPHESRLSRPVLVTFAAVLVAAGCLGVLALSVLGTRGTQADDLLAWARLESGGIPVTASGNVYTISGFSDEATQVAHQAVPDDVTDRLTAVNRLSGLITGVSHEQGSHAIQGDDKAAPASSAAQRAQTCLAGLGLSMESVHTVDLGTLGGRSVAVIISGQGEDLVARAVDASCPATSALLIGPVHVN